MRTKTLLLTAALTVAGIASSMAQAVYSVNAVGYVNYTLRSVGYNLIANPLNAGGNTLNEIFPPSTPLPDDCFVVTWNSAAGSIGGPDADVPFFFGGFGWDPAGPALPPGRSFFLYVPPTSANPTYNVTYVGEVPEGAPLSNPVAVNNRYSALASQAPTAGRITTDLGLQAAGDDIALVWDKPAGAFSSVTYTFFDGFGWDPAEPSIGVGDGFFLFRSAAGPTAWTRNFDVTP
jgi:hypothetical protein